MGINVVDTPPTNQDNNVQKTGETREIQGVKMQPVNPKIEEATIRIQRGQGSSGDYKLVSQAANNTQTVNNNLRRTGL